MTTIEDIIDAKAAIRQMQAIVAYIGAKNSDYSRMLVTEADEEMLAIMLGDACGKAEAIAGQKACETAKSDSSVASRLQSAIASHMAGYWLQLCSCPDCAVYLAYAERELRRMARQSEADIRPVPPF